jgi:ribulose-phosphate 3-epimerase
VEVDGGVDAVTCEVCKENGADVLVAGSAYFKAEDRAAFVKIIQK